MFCWFNRGKTGPAGCRFPVLAPADSRHREFLTQAACKTIKNGH
jgi:hypothetical protein